MTSGTVNLKYTTVKAKFDGVDYVNQDRIKDVSFSIKNVQHPKKHKPWSFNARITPSIHADRNVYHPVALDTSLPNYKISRFIGLGNLKLNIHFPIGNLVFAAGFGGTVYKQTSNQGLNTTKTREIKKFEIAWINFLSKRIFLLFGPRIFIDDYETRVFALRLGYFWGDT